MSDKAINADALAENKVFIAQLKAYLDLKNMDLVNRDLLEQFNKSSETIPMPPEELAHLLRETLEEANQVAVNKDQLQTLIDLNYEYKADIIGLVSVFGQFSGLLNGKSGAIAIGSAVVKLLGNEQAKLKLASVIPIIEKYTENNGE